MDNFLFDAFSQLTGGIITDLKTAMLAIFTIFLILIGFDLVSSVLKGRKFSSCHSDEALERLREKRDVSSGFERDYFNSMYNKRLNNRVKFDMSRGKGCD